MGISKLDNVVVGAKIELHEENPYLSEGIDTREERCTKGSRGDATN